MRVSPDELIPMAFFGWQMENGKQVLYQWWSTPFGKGEWRPVPMIEVSERKPSVAGFLEGDND